MLRITGTAGDFGARGLGRSDEDAAAFLLSDPQSPSSLLSICARARENNRTLIEILPRESWEEVNELHQLAAQPGAAAPHQRGEHLREVIGRTQAMAGLFLGAMNDDAGYAFLRLGRAMERGDFVTRVLLGYLEAIENGTGDTLSLRAADWVTVLRSLTAFQMYRRSVQGPVTGPRVVRFLTGSTVFPRALAYCAREIEQTLARLPASAPAAMAARFSSAMVDKDGPLGSDQRKFDTLVAVQAELAALHNAIGASYFVTLPEPARASQTQVQGA